MGKWYTVTKTINGCRYRYRQRTWREGKRVRTESVYLGPVGSRAVGSARSPRTSAPLPADLTALNEHIITSLKNTFAEQEDEALKELRSKDYVLVFRKVAHIPDAHWMERTGDELSPAARAKVDAIKAAVLKGERLPPILEMRTKPGFDYAPIYDGHHRLQAYKELGIDSIAVLKDASKPGKAPDGTILNLADHASKFAT